MKIIRNNIIPFPGYKAINLFGILFVRKAAQIDSVTLNHERIHTAQMKEMLYIPFYIWYGIEGLIKFVICWNAHRAYRNIGFEKEAHQYERYTKYLQERKHYHWICFV